METSPLVSVVMPCYNSAAFVSRAIESVLAQTFPHFELLIVDDCSKDDTRDVASNYLQDHRVSYIRHESNKGPSAARNTGIHAARGELVAFLDSDDYWMPQKLERQVEAFSDSEVGACYVAARREKMSRAGIIEAEIVDKTPPSGKDEFYIYLLTGGGGVSGSSSSVMARRKYIETAGLFNESLWTCEDTEMWMRLAAMYRFFFIKEPLVYVTYQPQSNSSNLDRMAEGNILLCRTVEKNMPRRFRHLLPKMRQYRYWRIARLYSKSGQVGLCRRYCIKAILSSRGPDRTSRRAMRLLARISLPKWAYYAVNRVLAGSL